MTPGALLLDRSAAAPHCKCKKLSILCDEKNPLGQKLAYLGICLCELPIDIIVH